ncbi:MAG: thiamine pyrophosphate-binding protein [Myxococcota bacterium]|nr:thiamine pyrophosphate-binding protein [Myxococcota bacterium]
MNGGKQVAQFLKKQGVEELFTLCGGHISPILVEAKNAGMRIIDVRHEANAAFAADAVSRLRGIPGVAVVTAGPGVTNTLTAIKNAQLAQSPLLLIGGATATLLRGRGSLQDIDQLELIKPHVKWAARPDKRTEILPAIEQALKKSKEGTPGPVFVEIAVDLLYEEKTVRDWYKAKTDKKNPNLLERMQSIYIKRHLRTIFGGKTKSIQQNITYDIFNPSSSEVQKTARMLLKAERPVLIIGSQTMLHPTRETELVRAVERLNLPVFLSGMARGLLGANHRLQLRHKRSKALKEADLVLLSGVPVDFRLNYGSPLRKAKVISVNLDATDLHKNRKPDLPILADPHFTLCALAQLKDYPTRDAWLNVLRDRNDARDREIRAMANEVTKGINPIQFCIQLNQKLQKDSVLIGDGGDFVATASYIVEPRSPYSWLDPGVFGTLGVGAGFAMGAKCVKPNADVWILYGDGAAGFSIMEFDTFVRQQLPVIAVVGNDGGWTQIARDQVEILKDEVGTVLNQMDYHLVAKACGGEGFLLDDVSKTDEILTKAIEVSRKGIPVLINVLIGKTDFRKGSISM